jgi:predicted RecA/RadA family phage recombinase
MADEARSVRDAGVERAQAGSAVAAYEVVQMPSGKAGILDRATGISSGSYAEYATEGTFNLEKTSGFAALKGNRAYWDFSANAVNYKKVNDRDFYLGRFADDASATNDNCNVLLNEDPPYDIDVARDPFDTVILGTQGLNTMGLFRRGGAHKFILSATNEAQKVDILSKDGFSTLANAIVEFAFEVVDDGGGTAVDVSVGVANDTHATDADSIASSVFMHLDANDVDILLESDDGTTEVAATDSTVDYTLGTRHEVWLDMRDPADVQIYVDGVLMLPATVFDVSAAATTWKLLCHIEKTAATDIYEFDLEWMRALYADQ